MSSRYLKTSDLDGVTEDEAGQGDTEGAIGVDLKELETRMRKVEKDLAGVRVTENEAATRLAADLQSKLDEWKQNIAETYRQEFEKLKQQYAPQQLNSWHSSKAQKEYQLNMAKLHEGISDEALYSYNWQKIWGYICNASPKWNVDKLYHQRWIIGMLNRWIRYGNVDHRDDQNKLQASFYEFRKEDVDKAKEEQEQNRRNKNSKAFSFPENVMHFEDKFFKENQLNWRRMAAFWRAVNLIDKPSKDDDIWPYEGGDGYQILGARWVI